MMDPERDDRLYCDRCLHLFTDDEIAALPDDPSEPDECHVCHRELRLVGHQGMLAIVRERQADEDGAREDGLIR